MKNRLTIILGFLLVLITCLPISFAQDFHLWELPKGVKARLGKGWITDMAFSPDGSQLAVACSIGIWLYNINTGTEDAFLKGHSELVTSVAYSPDGKTLASGSSDWTIRLWDVGNRKHIKTLGAHKGPVNTVTYSLDGKTLASGGNDGIRLWNVEGWEHRHIFRGRLASVTSLVYSPDGKTLTSGCRDGRIHLWDALSGGHNKTIIGHKRIVNPETYSRYISSLKYSPDGTTLASWSNGELLLYDPISKKSMQPVNGYRFPVYSLAFSLNGNTIAIGGQDGAINLWDTANLTHKRSLPGHTDKVTSVVYSPKGNIYASASLDGTIRLWGAVSKLPKRLFAGHTRYVACVVYSPDGRTLASAGMNGDVHLWDVETGKYIQTLSEPADMENPPEVIKGHSWRSSFAKMVTSLAYSPDGKTLACGSMDNKIRMWDANNGRFIRMLDPHIDEVHPFVQMDDIRHQHSVRSLAYSPDGKTLVSGSKNGKIRLWNPKRGWHLQTLAEPKSAVTSISFAPDGKTFVSNGNHNIVRMWDVKKWQHKHKLEANFLTSSMTSVVYSPDGKTIAGGCADNTIYLWNTNTSVLRQKLSGHTDRVTSVAFSPDGSILASASFDRTIHLWDTITGQMMQTISGQLGSITAVAYSPDGSTLASASGDGTILIWKLPSFTQVKVSERDKNSKQNISQWNLSESVKIRICEGWVNDIAYSSDGYRLAVASNIGTRIYNTITGGQVALFKASLPIRWITYSPDGRSLVGSSRSEIFSLDAMTGVYIYIIPMSNWFVHSPDGNTIATWGNGPIQLWNAATGQKIQTFNASWNSNSLSYSPDGTMIVYSVKGIGVSEKVQLWDVVKRKHKQTLSGHTHTVEKVVYAPDGKTLASIGRNINGYSGSKDLEIILWDAETGNLKHTLACDWYITELLYSPDAKTLAGGSSTWIYLWDVSSGKIIYKLNGDAPFVYAPDGKTIAGVSGSTIRLWDTLSGEKLKTLKRHTEKITLLKYSPNGKTLASLSGLVGNEIRIWDIDIEINK